MNIENTLNNANVNKYCGPEKKVSTKRKIAQKVREHANRPEERWICLFDQPSCFRWKSIQSMGYSL